MAATRGTATFEEMPGRGLDFMRDYHLSTLGYEETEYRIDGTATSYDLVGERGADGMWETTPRAEAPFRTRFVVRRPVDPARFSGTVVVEWHNVSAGLDAAPDWGFLHRYLAGSRTRLGRRLGAESGDRRRRRRRRSPPQARRARALWRARASGRCLVLRHVLPGRRSAAPAWPGRAAPRARPHAADRRRRVAVGCLPRDLHQCHRCARPPLRRFLRPRPALLRACRSTACSSRRRRRERATSRRHGAPSRGGASASAPTSACPCSCCRARPT